MCIALIDIGPVALQARSRPVRLASLRKGCGIAAPGAAGIRYRLMAQDMRRWWPPCLRISPTGPAKPWTQAPMARPARSCERPRPNSRPSAAFARRQSGNLRRLWQDRLDSGSGQNGAVSTAALRRRNLRQTAATTGLLGDLTAHAWSRGRGVARDGISPL